MMNGGHLDQSPSTWTGGLAGLAGWLGSLLARRADTTVRSAVSTEHWTQARWHNSSIHGNSSPPNLNASAATHVTSLSSCLPPGHVSEGPCSSAYPCLLLPRLRSACLLSLPRSGPRFVFVRHNVTTTAAFEQHPFSPRVSNRRLVPDYITVPA